MMTTNKQSISSFLLASIVIFLTACGGGASNTQNPDLTLSEQSTYTGPSAATQDVLLFQSSVWNGLKNLDRCGSCHVEGDQAPMFVRQDDVNAAYTAANSVVNLVEPDQSLLVTKVAAGHNCWLSSNAACGVAVAAYVEAWANGSSGTTKTIDLKVPATLRDPGESKNFPAGSSGFSGLHSLLTQHCQDCHIDSSETPQSPFFASDVIDEAYEAAKSVMNLNLPSDSRMVVRLRDEFHNCWDNCATDSAELLSAITIFSNSITPDAVDPQLLFSKGMGLSEGIVASGGSRYEDNVIALYEFKSGSGATVIDSSGVPPSLDLSLSGDISWVGGWGIQITSGKAQGSTTTSKKLTDLIRSTGEYSIEAWVAPANVTQEDARIVSYSGSTTTRNFMLGQTLYNYVFLNRNGNSDANGEPSASTVDDDEVLQATLQHVVITYDSVNGRRIYVNGELNGDPDTVTPSNLNDWDNSFAFVLGNEVSNDRQWQGTIRMVAIHNRALSSEQIVQNFEVGVGEKFFLLFNVDAHSGLENSFVVFEVSQFDNYSYLFTNPVFIVIGENPVAPQSL
ncbi:MAG: LamG domain-containing protein, partial [Gammaproteobacteria bacterium]